MKKFIIASNNNAKVKELDRILNPLGITAVTAASEGIDLGDVEETGKTFAENAYIKALAAYKKTGLYYIPYASGSYEPSGIPENSPGFLEVYATANGYVLQRSHHHRRYLSAISAVYGV